jgi:hypothetical protein
MKKIDNKDIFVYNLYDLPPELLLKIFKNIWYFSPIIRLICKKFMEIIDINSNIFYRYGCDKITNFLTQTYPSIVDEQLIICKIVTLANYIFILESFAESCINEKIFYYYGENIDKEEIIKNAYKVIKKNEYEIDIFRSYVGNRIICLQNRIETSIMIISFFGIENLLKRFKPPTWVNETSIYDEINDRSTTKFFMRDILKLSIIGGNINFITKLTDQKPKLEESELRRIVIDAFLKEKEEDKKEKWFKFFYDILCNPAEFKLFHLYPGGRVYLRYEFLTLPIEMVEMYLRRVL